MLKLAGIFIVFAAFLYCGLDAGRRCSMKLNQAATLCRLCVKLRDSISFNRASASDIIKDFDFGKGNYEGFRDELCALSPEAADELDELLDGLSTVGGVEAVKLCDFYLKRFNERMDELAADEPKKRRIYATLSITFAAALIVLII